jgi:hypothetical protein
MISAVDAASGCVSGDRYGENRSVFAITNGPGEVNAWSEVRLPFQPKGEMFEFRQRLGAAIRAMAGRLPGG